MRETDWSSRAWVKVTGGGISASPPFICQVHLVRTETSVGTRLRRILSNLPQQFVQRWACHLSILSTTIFVGTAVSSTMLGTGDREVNKRPSFCHHAAFHMQGDKCSMPGKWSRMWNGYRCVQTSWMQTLKARPENYISHWSQKGSVEGI